MSTVETPARDLTAAFMSGCSIEIVPTETALIDPAIQILERGSCVYVASIPGREACIVETSARLRTTGFEPIPHISARSLKSIDQLDDLLRRLRGEADVHSALLLGGDIDDSKIGAFASSRAMLETGLFARHGFKKVGFATYAEPHPQIAKQVLDSELMNKLKLAEEQDLSSWLVTQLCFDPEKIIRHAESIRLRGIRALIHVGVVGPTSWKSMARFAMICGVSLSARSFATQGSRVGRLLLGYEPAEIITRLASVATERPDLGFSKAHFFTFGGPSKTVNWIKSFVGGKP